VYSRSYRYHAVIDIPRSSRVCNERVTDFTILFCNQHRTFVYRVPDFIRCHAHCTIINNRAAEHEFDLACSSKISGSLKSNVDYRVWKVESQKKKTESAIFLACVCVLPLALIALRILLTQALVLRAFLALRWKLLALRTLLCVCWEGNQASLYPTLPPLCPTNFIDPAEIRR